jgi:hypothetical protein
MWKIYFYFRFILLSITGLKMFARQGIQKKLPAFVGRSPTNKTIEITGMDKRFNYFYRR